MTPSPTSWVKRIALRWLPPIVSDALRTMLGKWRPAVSRAAPEAIPPATELPSDIAPIVEPVADPAPLEWEIMPDTDETWASLGGWDHGSIVETQLAKWPGFLQSVAGPGMMGRSHEAVAGPVDLATHNTIVSFGYALGRSCDRGRTVSVLDWGGGLGHYAVYARALFPEQAFDFHVKDLPGLCTAGAALLPDVSFHADDRTALSRRYDFVLASSAVHYVRDPYGKIAELCAASSQRLLITRTPVLEHGDDVLVVQRPHRYGYITEYAGWMMNRRRLVESVEAHGFRLERQFLVGEQPYLPDMEEQAQYYGFLFCRV